MDTETSRKTVMDAWAAFASRDPARIGAVFARDADWRPNPGTPPPRRWTCPATSSGARP
ncbi:hypothetical protein [Phenylobacterium sp.]|uniref:hypothetical protein n=1 Tax=Phenylobacterium sp. TaxID=1871053 RepID=UPI002FC776FA